MASEHKTQQEIILACSRGDVRLWRNNVGKHYAGDKTFVNKENLSDSKKNLEPGDLIIKNPRLLSYGLCVGSSDLIGYKTITVTPDMVGQRIAVFSALEIKSATGRPTAQQCAFLEQIKKVGGIADIARSVQDAQMILRKWRNE